MEAGESPAARRRPGKHSGDVPEEFILAPESIARVLQLVIASFPGRYQQIPKKLACIPLLTQQLIVVGCYLQTSAVALSHNKNTTISRAQVLFKTPKIIEIDPIASENELFEVSWPIYSVWR